MANYSTKYVIYAIKNTEKVYYIDLFNYTHEKDFATALGLDELKDALSMIKASYPVIDFFVEPVNGSGVALELAVW